MSDFGSVDLFQNLPDFVLGDVVLWRVACGARRRVSALSLDFPNLLVLLLDDLVKSLKCAVKAVVVGSDFVALVDA